MDLQGLSTIPLLCVRCGEFFSPLLCVLCVLRGEFFSLLRVLFFSVLSVPPWCTFSSPR